MGKWEMVRLGDVGQIITGNTPKTSESSNFDSNDIPFFKPGDLRDIGVTALLEADNYISNNAKNKIRMLPANSVLVTCIGIIGKVGITRKESTCNQQVNAIIPDNEKCNERYIAYAVLNSRNQLNHIANAAVVPIINKSQFSNIFIPLPPLPDQQQIANVLDRASALIEKRKAQIDKLDLLVKSQFIEMFGDPVTNPNGWKKRPFSYVATIDTQMTRDFVKYADYPHIGIESIEKDTGRILDYKLVKDSDLKSGKYPFDERHLIYSKIRPNLNKVAKPYFEGVCSADAYPILPTCNSNRDYLSIVLRSDFFLDYILAFSGRTNIPKVNKKQLEGFYLPVPPIALQNEFADFVHHVEAQKSLLQQSLAKLEQNYKSLMQKCFRGEIF